MPSTEKLLCEDRGQVRVLTIHRPEKLNALNAEVLRDLRAAFSDARADAEVRAVILTGAGEKSFVAGADIGELSEKDPVSGKAQTLLGQAILSEIESMPKPVVAAVNGFALGGGLELALACHMRVLAATARVGLPEVKLGLIPGYGGTQRLPRLVGRGRALEMILSGEMIGAETALAWGLANRVAPRASETVDVALELLRPMLERAPLALAGALEAVRRGTDVDLGEGLRVEADIFSLICTTGDMKEGTRAFIEKRPAKFAGR
jgi:enoyl-CoA hydratase